jgi:hypothetical protein
VVGCLGLEHHLLAAVVLHGLYRPQDQF